MKSRFGPACVVICLLAATARGQDLDVLKAIPSSADAFVIVKKISDLEKKVDAVAKRMKLQAPGDLESIKALLGVDAGFDLDGVAAIAFTAPDVTQVLYVPVTDFAALVKSLGATDAGDGLYSFRAAKFNQQMALGKKGKYALISEARVGNMQAIRDAIKHDSVADQVKPIAGWLASQDVAAVALTKAVKKYAKLGMKKIDEFPRELDGLPEDQAAVVKAEVEWTRSLVRTVGEEVTYLAIGGLVDGQDNLKVSVQAGYVKDGSFSKSLASTKQHPLAGMPSASYAIVMGATFTQESMKSLMAFSAEMSRGMYKLKDAETKELAKAMNDNLKGVEAMSFAMQAPQGENGWFSGVVTVYKVDDAKDYLRRYVVNTQTSNKIMKVPSSATTIRLGELPAVEIVMDMKDLIAKEAPESAQMIEKMFGSDKVSTTLAAVDAKTIVMGYVPAAKMKRIVEGYANRKMLVDNANVAKTLKLLPENPSMVTLFNPKEFATMVVNIAKASGAEIPAPEIGETPPIGIAARSEATKMEIQFVLPSEVIDEIGRFVRWTKGL